MGLSRGYKSVKEFMQGHREDLKVQHTVNVVTLHYQRAHYVIQQVLHLPPVTSAFFFFLVKTVGQSHQ